MGPVAMVVQFLMGGMVLGSLVYKRYKETPQRPWRVWMMDVSKQLMGQMLVHMLNVVFSSNTTSRNPCALYVLNVLLDTTLGVGIIYVVMHFLQHALSDVLQWRGFVSGHYSGNDSWARWNAWLRQLSVYLVAICVMKFIVVLLIEHVSFLITFGAWLLDLFGTNRSMQVVFSMAIFPLAMNTLQFWMIDSMGHRGASAAFPENTLASFERAIRDGADGIESDVHITKDDVIVMFHDTTLDRTTNSSGPLAERTYYGENGVEHVRTLEEPVQQIPTFEQVCTLLMKPENRHVQFNVDIKPNNDPERLFRLMKATVSKYPDYESALAPRLILGLWHPKFIPVAKKHVPSLRRAHIGASTYLASKYFWDDCDAFSMYFPSLVSAAGQAFIRKARAANKDVMVWTVNREDEMVEAARWGVRAILTDRTDVLHRLNEQMRANFDKTYRENVSGAFSWGALRYYSPAVWMYERACQYEIERHANASFAQPAEPLPLVLWHGLGDSANSLFIAKVRERVEDMYPGIVVHSVYLKSGLIPDQHAGVFSNVNDDIQIACAQLASIPELRHGFDAVGFSQGGQFLRAYVERCNKPRVRNLITLGSQHMGITQLPECVLGDPICHTIHRVLEGGIYNDYAQSHVVPAQYFRDTRSKERFEQYLAKNSFIRDINNEGTMNETYRANMLKLNKFVMAVFDRDTTVVPRNSSIFSAYPDPVDGTGDGRSESDTQHDLTHTVPLRESSIYTEDRIGLRELDRRGDLVTLTCHGIHVEMDSACIAQTFGRYVGRPRNAFAYAYHAFAAVFIGVYLLGYAVVKAIRERNKKKAIENTEKMHEVA
ncbi:hypothetical protein MCUN1_001823 [Malassezia cuniculi]|uniref:palmitoyl-protein hydrolase n=1 Tax=Malassezia cuniculi TaxID=948313 RepID=A0AAF0J5Z1_9BASI|nr:hypothetical protein MCUN1_001823 [Malassezia cuniculi]